MTDLHIPQRSAPVPPHAGTGAERWGGADPHPPVWVRIAEGPVRWSTRRPSGPGPMARPGGRVRLRCWAVILPAAPSAEEVPVVGRGLRRRSSV